jgi:DNA-binding GntR family transcriptional regulator
MTLLSADDLSYQARAAKQVRDWILDGTLAPGTRLNEVALSRQLGISRGPLREAIQRVAAQGLVTIVRHRGSFVREFGAEQIHHLYEVRTALEQAVAARLARTRTDDALRQIRDLVLASAEALDRDGGCYPGDLDFHTTLAGLCGNPDLAANVHTVNTQLALARVISGNDRGRAGAALTEHRAIARAIARNDDTKAAEAMRVHLERSCASTLTLLG